MALHAQDFIPLEGKPPPPRRPNTAEADGPPAAVGRSDTRPVGSPEAQPAGFHRRFDFAAAVGCPAEWAGRDYSVLGHLGLQLHYEILDWVRYIRPTDGELCSRAAAIRRLRTVICEVYTAAEVQVIGSMATGTALPDSGLDLLVTRVPPSPQALGSIAAALLKKGVALVAVARQHPVFGAHLKGKLRDSHLPVRIVIAPADAKSAASLLPEWQSRYLALFRAATPLLLVVKQFLRQRQLHRRSTGGVDPFLTFLMVVSFLQQHPSNTTAKNEKPLTSLGHLLLDFMEVYGKYFNYQCLELSLADGGSYALRPSPTDVFLPRVVCQTPFGVVGQEAWRVLRARDAFAWASSVLAHAVATSPEAGAPPFTARPTLLSRILFTGAAALKQRAEVQAVGWKLMRSASPSPEELDCTLFGRATGAHGQEEEAQRNRS
eukprot:GGOE01044806.1.p1 GENE.GGOE01044806.1~~GGOE01044806.1.p1  ORF type:complete len:433 (+),score=102.75 GGOE01044806.1:99-1397(+)